MSDIQFNEPEYGSRDKFAPKEGFPTKMVIKFGLAKDAKQAQVVLLVITAVAVAIGLFFAF